MKKVILFTLVLLGYSLIIGCDRKEPVPEIGPLIASPFCSEEMVNPLRVRGFSEKISDVRARALPILFENFHLKAILAIIEGVGNHRKGICYVATVIEESKIVRLEVGENWHDIVQYETNDRVMKKLRNTCAILHNYHGETIPGRVTVPLVFVTLYKGHLPSSVFCRNIVPLDQRYMQYELEITKNKYAPHFYELFIILSKLKQNPCKEVDLSRIGFYKE